MSFVAPISGTVGKNGKNMPTDVQLIQQLLNSHLSKLFPAKALVVDGKVGPKTIGLIEEYQKRVLKHNNPDGRVDPGGKTFQSLTGAAASATATQAKVAFALSGWKGDKHATGGFEFCRETMAGAIKGATVISKTVNSKQDFINVLKQAASSGVITELHMYSHSAVEGPTFVDGHITPAQLEKGALPTLSWAKGAEAVFYGCNAGLSPWTTMFGQTQKVNVRGSAGYSLFSKKPDKFVPFFGDPDSKPCYLDCFPGMLNLLYEKHGVSKVGPIHEFWRKLKLAPKLIEGVLKESAPRPMKSFKFG